MITYYVRILIIEKLELGEIRYYKVEILKSLFMGDKPYILKLNKPQKNGVKYLKKENKIIIYLFEIKYILE